MCQLDFITAMSVDSWYYPGVLDEMASRAKHHATTLYIIGNDYDACYRDDKFTGFAADSESRFIIDSTGVTSIVKDNPIPYKHKFLKTSDNSWQYLLPDGGALVFTIVDTIQNADIPYRLMRGVYVENPMTGLPTFKWSERWRDVQMPHVAVETVDYAPKQQDSILAKKMTEMGQTICTRIQDSLDKWNEKVYFKNGKVNLSVSKNRWYLLGGQTVHRTYSARPEWIIDQVARFMGKVTPLEVVRLSRTAFQDKLKETKNLNDAEEMSAAVIIAVHYASVSAGTIVSHVNGSSVVSKFKETMTGAVVDFRHSIDWKKARRIFFVLACVSMIVYGVVKQRAEEEKPEGRTLVQQQEAGLSAYTIFGVVSLIFYIIGKCCRQTSDA